MNHFLYKLNQNRPSAPWVRTLSFLTHTVLGLLLFAGVSINFGVPVYMWVTMLLVKVAVLAWPVTWVLGKVQATENNRDRSELLWGITDSMTWIWLLVFGIFSGIGNIMILSILWGLWTFRGWNLVRKYMSLRPIAS